MARVAADKAQTRADNTRKVGDMVADIPGMLSKVVGT